MKIYYRLTIILDLDVLVLSYECDITNYRLTIILDLESHCKVLTL